MKTQVRVKVRQGTVVGVEKLLPNGKPYQYFRGIPYAVPPVGELRFQAPIALDAFETREIDCTQERDVSLQRDPFTGEFHGTEDCLFLNVYAPKPKADTRLPVMVFIHGGAFMYGSGNSILYTPLYLIQENVIVVTLNYRLGVLGLLALPEANMPGNMGIKDQRLALQWVKENIGEFNGDHNNVTLFGESAGSACAHLHLLSESSKKLFHKLILQSGTANMVWAGMDRPSPRIMKLANLMGCKSEDPLEVVQYLKKYSNVKDFIKYAQKIVDKEEVRRSMSIPLRPVVEKVTVDAIVTEDPLKAMSRPNSVDVPVMMGYTSAEGIMFLSKAIKDLSVVDKDLARFVPAKFKLRETDPKYLDLAQKIRNFYFEGGVVDESKVNALADAYGDMHFIIDCYVTAEVHSRKQPKSPLYFYRFDYTGGLNLNKQLSGFSHLKGACHTDELFYLFQSDAAKEPWDEKDKRMVEKMCKLWTNFAKYGNPTPDKKDRFVDCTWEPVRKIADNEKFNLNAFIIDEQQRMLDNPNGDRIEFWREIYRTCDKNTHSNL